MLLELVRWPSTDLYTYFGTPYWSYSDFYGVWCYLKIHKASYNTTLALYTEFVLA